MRGSGLRTEIAAEFFLEFLFRNDLSVPVEVRLVPRELEEGNGGVSGKHELEGIRIGFGDFPIAVKDADVVLAVEASYFLPLSGFGLGDGGNTAEDEVGILAEVAVV